MRIRVFDIRGHLLRNWDFTNDGSGFVIDWDGRTNAGAIAPSGWYIFDIRFRNTPYTSGARFKMLHLRGALGNSYDWEWF